MAYSVEALEREVPVSTYLSECVDVERFLECCKSCSYYAGRWSCPPFSFRPLQFWRQYDRLHLFARVLHPLSHETSAGLLEGLREEKSRLLRELLDMEKKKSGSQALDAGSCDLCGNDCMRPKGEQCRNPQAMRYSIESLGGDVEKTMELYFHRSIVWIGKETFPEYLTLVGGLLLK